MDQRQIIEIAQQAIMLMVVLSAPVMVVGLVVGLVVALFQALTQIQELTLAFVPKIIAIFMVMMFFLPHFMSKLGDFTTFLSDQIVAGDIRDGS